MDTKTLSSLEKRSETDLISFLVNYSIKNNYSLALWRLPNSEVRRAILSREYKKVKKDNLLEESPAGFIFSPFDNTKDSYFLDADFSFCFEKGEIKLPSTPAENNSWIWLQEQFKKEKEFKPQLPDDLSHETQSTEKNHYKNLVEKCLEQINAGTFEKVVPSRRKLIDLPSGFNLINAFLKLCNAYPNAMVSCVSIPGVGHWMGASPELLVSMEDNTIFKTVALAGTKPYTNNLNLKTVAWTEKEIEEQALVERYIISCFKKIRLREYDEHGPKTFVAGNLLHLKSEFTVDMKATNFPQLGSTMLQLLHPTSAVCGMPLDTSLQFIKDNEGYDREFYAGYLGPVNIQNTTNIFVNIRCMKLLGAQAICYAGAGVTQDSDPEEEWLETELKFNTLLNIIQ
ncbi:MAG TPA: chorismate-binding protein [Cyclobacteriaceae bacterium]